jgi:hypothetical protein
MILGLVVSTYLDVLENVFSLLKVARRRHPLAKNSKKKTHFLCHISVILGTEFFFSSNVLYYRSKLTEFMNVNPKNREKLFFKY